MIEDTALKIKYTKAIKPLLLTEPLLSFKGIMQLFRDYGFAIIAVAVCISTQNNLAKIGTAIAMTSYLIYRIIHTNYLEYKEHQPLIELLSSQNLQKMMSYPQTIKFIALDTERTKSKIPKIRNRTEMEVCAIQILSSILYYCQRVYEFSTKNHVSWPQAMHQLLKNYQFSVMTIIQLLFSVIMIIIIAHIANTIAKLNIIKKLEVTLYYEI